MKTNPFIPGHISLLLHRPWLVISTILAITLLLAIPTIYMAPDEIASQDPGGEVFDLQTNVDTLFSAPTHQTAYLAEAKNGDILTSDSLLELYKNSQELLKKDRMGKLTPEGLPSQPYLYSFVDPDTDIQTVGIAGNIAFAVQNVLINDPDLLTSLEHATNDEVKIAVHKVLSNPQFSNMKAFLAEESSSEKRVIGDHEIDYWISPATMFSVLADNELLGGGTLSIGVGTDEVTLGKEKFNRNVQSTLRGNEFYYQLWGIAIDVNLESFDQGQTAGMYIMLTVIAASLIVWIGLRSYWAMVLTSAGLGILMVWLKGISALIGLKGGLIIDLIVPIAMIALGVDFAVHAIRRYQEEKHSQSNPKAALAVGLSGVLGALVLAMLSDSIAFLSNISSGIEAVIQFGIAAAIAVSSAFVVLGIIVPITLMKIETLCPTPIFHDRRIQTLFKLFIGTATASAFATSIIFLVAVSKPTGIILLSLSIFVFIVIPVFLMHFRNPVNMSRALNQSSSNQLSATAFVENLTLVLARRAKLVLCCAIVFTTICTWFALKLEPTFDVKDFFDYRSDLVISLDKLDEHMGTKAGEPGFAYIKGNISNPDTLLAINKFIEELPEVPEIATYGDNQVLTGLHVIDLVKNVTSNESLLETITQTSGVVFTDPNVDGIPNTKEQVNAIFDFVTVHGVPLNRKTLRYTPEHIGQILYHDKINSENSVTILEVPIAGSREQSTVTSAYENLDKRLDILEGNPEISLAGLTGSPFTRDAQLRATTDTLQRSMPIAAAGAFLLLLITMKSLRYALVTIIPIGLVVVWLYGLMYIGGFALNFVTATIGALSIGVGIDYSIHMTARFREELSRSPDKLTALRQTSRGTGVALVASAASSIVGFAIIGFAPMPMFSAYGQLTALMIFLALTASLIVLPPLLFLVTRTNK